MPRPRLLASCLAIAALVALAGCRTSPSARASPRAEPAPARAAASSSTALPVVAAPTAVASAAPAEVPDAGGGLAPLEGPELFAIDLDDGGKAFVVAPVGARTPRPVILGVHGAGDRADWSCVEWEASARNYPFVVCPQGVPTSKDFYAWGSPELIARRGEKALAAVRARFGAHVADGPVTYGGWSQGSTLAANVVASRPGLFGSVVLLELGHTPLDAGGVAYGLKQGGVTRAVISCSSPPCRNKSRELERSLPRVGIAVGTNDVGDRGHWFDDPVFRSLGPKIGWVTEGDARWDGLREVLAREARDGDGGP